MYTIIIYNQLNTYILYVIDVIVVTTIEGISKQSCTKLSIDGPQNYGTNF